MDCYGKKDLHERYQNNFINYGDRNFTREYNITYPLI
jgi:hypothetical protein